LLIDQTSLWSITVGDDHLEIVEQGDQIPKSSFGVYELGSKGHLCARLRRADTISTNGNYDNGFCSHNSKVFSIPNLQSKIQNLQSPNNYTGMGSMLVLLFMANFESGRSTGGRSLTPKEHNISDIMTKMLAFL